MSKRQRTLLDLHHRAVNAVITGCALQSSTDRHRDALDYLLRSFQWCCNSKLGRNTGIDTLNMGPASCSSSLSLIPHDARPPGDANSSFPLWGKILEVVANNHLMPWSCTDEVMVAATMLYNPALLLHLRGLQNDSIVLLKKARRAYNQAMMILQTDPQFFMAASQLQGPGALIYLAIVTNSACIHASVDNMLEMNMLLHKLGEILQSSLSVNQGVDPQFGEVITRLQSSLVLVAPAA